MAKSGPGPADRSVESGAVDDSLRERRGVVYPLSIAPMMDRTDRHYRYFARGLTRRTLLYTEMVVTGAILHGDRDRFLAHDPDEHPLALQLGGDDPKALAECAKIAEDRGFDEINLNVGCPSDRVQKGSFGVCLMGRPETVADGVAAMRAAVRVPVTVKHRIGFDDRDRYDDMARFVDVVARAGCDRFAVHARKAWLTGLSPKENRDVPSLRYGDVYRLKEERPELTIEINGGVRSLDAARSHLARVDGVMIGRAAFDDPWMLAEADSALFGEPERHDVTRRHAVERMLPYLEARLREGVRPGLLVRPLLALYSGCPGARAWRRALTEGTRGPRSLVETVVDALERIERARSGSVTIGSREGDDA